MFLHRVFNYPVGLYIRYHVTLQDEKPICLNFTLDIIYYTFLNVKVAELASLLVRAFRMQLLQMLALPELASEQTVLSSILFC